MSNTPNLSDDDRVLTIKLMPEMVARLKKTNMFEKCADKTVDLVAAVLTGVLIDFINEPDEEDGK